MAAGRGPGEEVDKVMSKGGVAEIYMRYFTVVVVVVVGCDGGGGGGGGVLISVDHSLLVKGYVGYMYM